MGKEKLVSIVILNWNGKDDIKQCIESIRQNTQYENFEIIVVDNGSNDGSVEMLRELKKNGMIKKLVLNPRNVGFGPGNNQGMAIAGGDYVFLLNNDTIVTKGWLENIVKVAESRQDVGIVGPYFPLVQNPDAPDGGGFIDDAGRAVLVRTDRDMEVEQVSGGAFLIKKSVIGRIGFFDRGFSPIYFEESDYCNRARRAGFKVLFTLKSKILHNESSSTKKQASKWRFVTINKNRIRYVLIHFPKARLAKFFFWEMLRLAKDVFNLRIHWLLEAWAINIANIPEIVRKRADYKKGKLFVDGK